jgi:hypothetical protein
MKTVFGVAAAYSARIVDGRTQEDVLKYMKDEVEELELEVEGQLVGPDGIFGEAIDVMACAADMVIRELRKQNPDITIEEAEKIAADYMEAKCEKWLKNVEARKYPHQSATGEQRP